MSARSRVEGTRSPGRRRALKIACRQASQICRRSGTRDRRSIVRANCIGDGPVNHIRNGSYDWSTSQTTLWSMDQVSGATVAELAALERDTYAFWRDFARRPGGEYGREGDAMWFRSGIPLTNYN